MNKKYKGVAIFGAPGSGKTTTAKLLATSFPAAKHVEAFDLVIDPAASIKERLPRKESDLIGAIGDLHYQPLAKSISREEARNFFTYLKNRYSPSVIAKTLIFVHRKRFFKKFIIIAGIRGYQNAVYFKRNGYLVVHLQAFGKRSVARVSGREGLSRKAAAEENELEERIFSTDKIKKIAHLSFDTATARPKKIIAGIRTLVEARECRRCVNSGINPAVIIGRSGLCELCERYEKNFNKIQLRKELAFLFSLKNSGKKKYDAMVGISGGKDSTAALYEVKRLGFTPLAFTLDTHYYPKHIFLRAERVAGALGVDHERIDARKYMRPVDRACFQKTATLYDERDSQELKDRFRKWYAEGRRHYSIKCRHALPFVRSCQLCRRLIVRAYYGEARRHGVSVVVLGINEWAGLSQNGGSKKFVFSAIRKLQPFKNKPPVYIVHLPFLLQRKIKDTENVLRKLGWTIPRGERLIESNANSCLFARAAENKARRMLGFHPDSTRLAREVTVGFITKKQARLALKKIHNYDRSVRQVLRRAGII